MIQYFQTHLDLNVAPGGLYVSKTMMSEIGGSEMSNAFSWSGVDDQWLKLHP